MFWFNADQLEMDLHINLIICTMLWALVLYAASVVWNINNFWKLLYLLYYMWCQFISSVLRFGSSKNILSTILNYFLKVNVLHSFRNFEYPKGFKHFLANEHLIINFLMLFMLLFEVISITILSLSILLWGLITRIRTFLFVTFVTVLVEYC